MSDFVLDQIKASRDLKTAVLEDVRLVGEVRAAAERIVAAYRAGKKVLLAGNGGSAADAQHIASELVGQFAKQRPGLAALALTTDSSILTAIGNDFGYDKVFSRQIEASGVAGDIFIAISTSGRSPNILEALRAAKAKGLLTVGLTGADASAMTSWCDHHLAVPSRETPRIQEAHCMLGHVLCAVVEEALFGEASGHVQKRPA
ncbi:MAG TPA: D-sedoheptulose 7-phosphate isomerase [Myxococcales bacterium]|jgi:D-sedoheptulose 7-phosphate isomerase